MNKFLLKTGLFMVLFVIPLSILDILLRHPKMDEFSAKHAFLEKNRKDCEALVMGSSYSQTGLNPEWLGKKSVNLSNYSQPFYYDYKILEKYIPRMHRLKTVVLSLSYPVFFSVPEKRQENLYSIFWGLEPFSGKKDIENYSLIMALGLEHLLERVVEGVNHYQYRGWYCTQEVYDGSLSTAEARLNIIHRTMDDKNWEHSNHWLGRIMAICRSNNIRLILFVPPFSKSMNSVLQNDAYYQKLRPLFEQLEQNESIEFYDFNDNEIFADRMFKDPDHLNKDGARILTTEMNSILASTFHETPLWVNHRPRRPQNLAN